MEIGDRVEMYLWKWIIDISIFIGNYVYYK